MNSEKAKELKQYEKFDVLKDAVMHDSPDDVFKMMSEFGELEFTALALGLACRFRGLDMVRALVDGGAKFTYDLAVIIPLYKKSKRNINIPYPDDNFAAALLDSCGLVKHLINTGKAYNRPILPINDRLRILSYLYKTADKTGFYGDELLFFSILSGEEKITDLLKKHGAVIPQKWIDIITKGSGGDRWLNYCWLVRQISNEDFIPVMTSLVSEICRDGERKLHITELFWGQNKRRLDAPGGMKFLLENFDLSNMNKTTLMKEIISRDDTECLEIIANYGWLKQPKKRDNMIAFANENSKTECTAWLLDFKNRTADLAAERARAEKKAERELNAAPDSVTALKQIWSYKKREDGSIIITGYKGSSTEVVVPAKIGKGEVKAIGKNAFTPYGSKKFRETITSVTLPESVCEIGFGAFSGCKSLRSVNIPEGVTEIDFETFNGCIELEKIEIPGSVKIICDYAFYRCVALKELVIPEGVTYIFGSPFWYCSLKTVEFPRSLKAVRQNADEPFETRIFDSAALSDLTALVPRGSYAEQYCINNKIKFEYKEEV